MLEKIMTLLAEELGVNEDEITEANSFKEKHRLFRRAESFIILARPRTPQETGSCTV